MAQPKTLFDKIWDRHTIHRREDGATLLYIDRHLAHDGSPRALEVLRARGLTIARPDRTFATPDHYVPTHPGRSFASVDDPERRAMIADMRHYLGEAGVRIFDLGDARQGIVHVVGPEQGITLPGVTLVCGDSHTATHGGIGALAFGIGASEVSHVLATQTLWQRRPKRMRITVDGPLGPAITPKDIILAIIGRIGAAGATGHAIEYAGSTIRGLSIEGRLTICNMSIEAGGRSGMVAPDDTTFGYIHGRPLAPTGAEWDRAVSYWRNLPTDADARFDREVAVAADELQPMVTWGTSPEHSAPVTGRIPDPAQASSAAQRSDWRRALDYMDLLPGTPLADIAIDRVFIGSCTNSRIEDLRMAARLAAGRKASVPAWVVPGSGLVKAQAEAEGLDAVFRSAGFEWREPGCSMCAATNGDFVAPGDRCASTSNRNFVGRQGKGARTHLVSPLMAVAAAVTGKLSDVRELMGNA
jgi:3-isopropylmalate/(R)-2-methylmalate dehydratase large subunit